MAAKPVKVAFLADTNDLRQSLSKAEQAMDDAAATAKTAGQKIDTAMSSTADSADAVASKGSQAAGALAGLGDLIGGKFGNAMMAGGVAMQAAADAGDLVNVVTESAIVKKIKDAAVTAAQTTATIAKTAAEKAAAAAAKAWAAAQWLLNAAMTANPIGIVVVAIAALVAGMIIAYKKSETFRAIVDKAWQMIKTATGAVFDWIKNKISTVIDTVKSIFLNFTGPGLIIKHWETIKTRTTQAFDTIKDTITGKFDAVVQFIKDVPGKIKNLGSDFLNAGKAIIGKLIDGFSSVGGLAGDLAGGIKTALGNVINPILRSIEGAINGGIDKINKLPGVNIPHVNIPELAKGGIVYGPTLALIGEAGPEAVVPLNGRYGMGQTIHVTVQVPATANPVATGREIRRVLDAYAAAGGA